MSSTSTSSTSSSSSSSNSTGTKLPTLTYFNVWGRAEVTRVLFEDAGVDYAFVPVTNWPEVKPQLTAAGKIAFGQLPLYEEPDQDDEEEGITIAQSKAIARHVARKHGYSGGNAREEALIDQASEGAFEMFEGVFMSIWGTAAQKSDENKTNLIGVRLPAQLANFERLLERNGNTGFLVRSRLSYADVHLWVTVQLVFSTFAGSRDSLLRDFPAVKKLIDGVSERERIKAYVARDVYRTGPKSY